MNDVDSSPTFVMLHDLLWIGLQLYLCCTYWSQEIAPEVLRRYGQANVGSVSAGCLHGVPEAGHAEVMSARCATKTERTARAAWPL